MRPFRATVGAESYSPTPIMTDQPTSPPPEPRQGEHPGTGPESGGSGESQESISALAKAREVTSSFALSVYKQVVERPVAVSMVALAFVVFGLASQADLPVTLMPELNYPSLTIRTNFPSAAPADVEERVSKLIEERIGNVPGLLRRSSVSRAEQSDVLLEFAWGTDMLDAVTRTGEAIDRVRLDPRVERPQILRYDPAQDPVVRIMLFQGEGSSATLAELRDFAEKSLKEKVSRAEGVAAVRVSGGLETQVRIYPDENKLRLHGLDADALLNAVRSSSVDSSAGLIVMDGREVLLRVINVFSAVDVLGSLDIQKPGGGTVKLKDLTKGIDLAPKDPDTITRYAAAGTGFASREGVLLEVLKEGDANIISTAHNAWKMLYGEQWELVRAGEAYPDRAARVAELARRAERKQPADPEVVYGLMHNLPADFGLSVLTDQARFIEASNREVANAVYFGGALAVAVIFLFLQSGWLTFLVFISIPLSVIATFIPMKMAGLTLNLMSLGGLALGVGMLVDSSIVVLESIARCRDQGDSPIQAAARGTSEVASAIIASTMTTVAVFFPIAFVEGMAGQIFREQALTVVFSLLASLVVALLVVPAYAGLSGSKATFADVKSKLWGVFRILDGAKWPKSVGRSLVFAPVLALNSIVVVVLFVLAALAACWVFVFAAVFGGVYWVLKRVGAVVIWPVVRVWSVGWNAVAAVYPKLLSGALNRPAATLSSALILAVGAFALASTLPTELVPPLNENEFYVDVAAPEGTKLETTDRFALNAIGAALESEELRSRLAGVMTEAGGTGDTTGRPVSSSRARFVLSFKAGELPSLEQVKELVSDPVSSVAGLSDEAEVSRPTLFTLRAPISVEVRGQDLKELSDIADELAGLMRGLVREDGQPLMFDIKTSNERGRPQIPIVLDRLKLRQYGLTAQVVADRVRRKLLGEVVADFDQRGEKIDIFLNLAEEDRARIDQIKNIEIERGIRLHQVLDGELKIEDGPSEILRVSNDRVVRVEAQPNGVPLGLVRQQMDAAFQPVMARLTDSRISQGGQQEELERSSNSLIFALLLAIFLVYVVMATQFESLIDPLLIMGSVPLAATGVALVLWLTSTPLSVVVMLGVIVLAGIVVNNAIMLVDCANRLRQEGMMCRAALEEACRIRLRPIAITTLTTVLGMLPLTGWLAAPLGGLADLLSMPVVSDVLHFLGGSGEGSEIRAPMAVTVVVGLATSTALTLLVIPVLYQLVHKERGAKTTS